MTKSKVLSWFISLLLSARLAAAMSPVPVTFVDANTGEHKVVVIHVKSDTGSTYTLSCDDDVRSCIIPDSGTQYSLEDSDIEIYKCSQNVALFPYPISHPRTQIGIYCLQAMN